jgi:hypothetical protein
MLRAGVVLLLHVRAGRVGGKRGVGLMIAGDAGVTIRGDTLPRSARGTRRRGRDLPRIRIGGQPDDVAVAVGDAVAFLRRGIERRDVGRMLVGVIRVRAAPARGFRGTAILAVVRLPVGRVRRRRAAQIFSRIVLFRTGQACGRSGAVASGPDRPGGPAAAPPSSP